ncbi:heterokaryon incompatibility protein-domain-containing protein [Dactylonectria macrodidyma]|uniref:Heterokaryon incompatibility protein-domain-containing protein n=1 Tax=Dactylonectria macrodidyma TaxID=307937 RepID=A0A9P9F5S8_9HYPO|nr:heterokaryon incompatibility protein-domain-containing protein [Dactylonectria macrodidyma]
MLAATRRFHPPTNTSTGFFHQWRESWEDDEVVLVWNKDKKTITVELGRHGSILPRFTFYCLTKGPDMPLISSPTAIVDDTRSEATMHRVLSWILACTTEHEHCGKNEPKPLPDRVLDLGDSHDSPIRLIDSHNQLGYYACLSHCWGPVQPLRTLSGNKIAFMTGVPMAVLPKTFQDAVSVCRQLNIRYFWVDSLCIVQDSIDEWQTQSSKMATIYENAFITIAATKAKGHEEGLHHSEEIEMYMDCIPASEIGHGINEDVYVRLNYDSQGGIKHWDIPDFGESQDQEWPLLTRAWVFQERLLSPRMLHFAKKELVWECRTGTFCDCGRRLTDASKEMPDMEFRRLVSSQSIKTSDVTPAQFRALWYAIVERYSRLMGNLTHEGDVFPALSGLATRISGLLDDEYVAGLWWSNMVEGLLWTYDIYNERPQPYRIRLPPKSWRAPTWSWASMTDAISYQNHSRFQWTRGNLQEVYARVIDVECTSTGSQKTGPISSAALTLSGWISSAKIQIRRISWGWRLSPEEPSFGLYCTLDRGPYEPSLFIDHPEDLVDGTRETCLRLARIANQDWYLVLVKETPSSTSFRRVGLFRGPDITWQWTSSESWRRRAQERYNEEKCVMRIV